MEGGLVRHVLVQHLEPALRLDPTLLVPAAPFAERLAQHDRDRPGSQAEAARAAAAGWARTFPTLVRHLRGRPERALALFAEEVYPFLRGDRLAARVEAHGAGHATLRLAPGLPDLYQAELAAAFLRLSGATVDARVAGPGVVELRHRVAGADVVARAAQALAAFRLPLLAAITWGILVGAAMAAPHATLPRLLVVLAGALCAQAGANALHDLRRADLRNPLTPFRQGRPSLRVQATAGYLGAAASGLTLWFLVGPGILAFALPGALVGLLWARLRERGLGPLAALAAYGPIAVLGARFALGGGLPDTQAALLSLVPGLLAAAVVHVDDLADLPLDQAGGQRTLAVRVAPVRKAAVYAVLVAAASVLLLLAMSWLAAAAVAVVAGSLAIAVHRRRDDPRGLAPARLATQLLHGAASVLIVLGSLP